jgi:hypothetical protein
VLSWQRFKANGSYRDAASDRRGCQEYEEEKKCRLQTKIDDMGQIETASDDMQDCKKIIVNNNTKKTFLLNLILSECLNLRICNV